jgi:tetratricopeptide (TPR) repeat protein
VETGARVKGLRPALRRLAAPVVCALAVLAAAATSRGAEPSLADTSAVIDPAAAWAAVAAAREEAAADRHHDAARGYLEALAHDARLVPDIVDELAYQKLWREDAEKAVFYFRRYLARHPEEPDRDARKGLALALSWSGRQPEAVALYRELVSEDPGDASVRLGLGRSLIWNNELNAGFARLRGVENDEPDSVAAGREVRRFLLQVLDGYTTPGEVRLDASWDSDDLDIYRLTLGGAWTIAGNKLLQVMPAAAWYRQPNRPGVRAPKLTLGLVAPLDHRWSLHAYASLEHLTSHGPIREGQELDWLVPGGDAWLTWLATHRLRLDLGVNGQPIETIDAFAREVYAGGGSVSADWRLSRHLTLGAVGQLADYSDSNTKRYGRALLSWRQEGFVEWRVGPSLTYLDFELPYPGGYWSPDWMRNVSLELQVATLLERWALRAEARYGREKEIGSDTIGVGGGSLHAGYRFAPSALIAAELGYSKSRFATASGYSRTFASLALRFFF